MAPKRKTAVEKVVGRKESVPSINPSSEVKSPSPSRAKAVPNSRSKADKKATVVAKSPTKKDETLEEILGGIKDKRKLTKLDKELRTHIEELESTSKKVALKFGEDLFRRPEGDRSAEKCQPKLYQRFRDLWEKRHGREAKDIINLPKDDDDDDFLIAESIESQAPKGPKKSASHPSVSKSPARNGRVRSIMSPIKHMESEAPVLRPSKLSRNKRTIAKQLREPRKSPPKSPRRVDKNISRKGSATSNTTLSPRKIGPGKFEFNHGPVGDDFDARFRGRSKHAKLLQKAEKEAFESVVNNTDLPIAASTSNEDRMDFYQAQQMGVARAQKQRGLQNDHRDSLINRRRSSFGDPRGSHVEANNESERTGRSARARSASPQKRKASRSASPHRRKISRSVSPAKRPTLRSAAPIKSTLPKAKSGSTASPIDKAPTSPRRIASSPRHPLKPNEPSAPGRGTVRTVTNPQYIQPLDNGEVRENPFFETMPAVETWHSRMPRYFPFGETPFMEAYYSQQIEEDLRKTHEDDKAKSDEQNRSILERLGSRISVGLEYIRGLSPGATATPDAPAPTKQPNLYRSSQWDLPEIGDDEVRACMRSNRKTWFGRKRKSSSQSSGSAVKRPRASSNPFSIGDSGR